jgi:hypothetical protein
MSASPSVQMEMNNLIEGTEFSLPRIHYFLFSGGMTGFTLDAHVKLKCFLYTRISCRSHNDDKKRKIKLEKKLVRGIRTVIGEARYEGQTPESTAILVCRAENGKGGFSFTPPFP